MREIQLVRFGSSPTDLEMTVDRIFGHLRELRQPIAEKFRPGGKPTMVATKLRSLGLEGPADLMQIYILCDRIEAAEGDPLDGVQIFSRFIR